MVWRGTWCDAGLFTPVWLNDSPHIDGGVFDSYGLMALPALDEQQRVVNIVFSSASIPSAAAASSRPDNIARAKLLTIVVTNVPPVNPFTMDERGSVAHAAAKQAMLLAIARGAAGERLQLVGHRHWACYVDASQNGNIGNTSSTNDSIDIGISSSSSSTSTHLGMKRGHEDCVPPRASDADIGNKRTNERDTNEAGKDGSDSCKRTSLTVVSVASPPSSNEQSQHHHHQQQHALRQRRRREKNNTYDANSIYDTRLFRRTKSNIRTSGLRAFL